MTTILNNGRIVLAHVDGRAKTYANRTAAQRAADKIGGSIWQSMGGPVFFVTPSVDTIACA